MCQLERWQAEGVRLIVLGIALVGITISLSAIAIADEKKAEAPPGYEDALTADEDAADAAVVDAIALARENNEERKRAVDANVLKMERQYIRHFTKMFDVERSFIPRVCELTKAERRELAMATSHIPKTAARKYATWQSRFRQGKVREAHGRNPTALDPRTLVLDELKIAVNKCLGQARAKRYELELSKRAEHRKRTAVLNLVAKLDQDLVLTADQRTKLTQSLTENWQAGWASSLRLFRSNNRHLPRIPDAYIVRILNPTQRMVWGGAQKQSLQIGGGMGFGNAILFVDDFEVDVDVKNGVDLRKRK